MDVDSQSSDFIFRSSQNSLSEINFGVQNVFYPRQDQQSQETKNQ